MPRKLIFLHILLSFLLLSSLSAAEKQVRVIVDRATIYAENNIYSYKIEIIKKGTILTVFETGAPMQEWFYVRYHSQRWKSTVTGFIQASMIEEITERPLEEPKREITEPKPKEEKVEPKPVEALKKPEPLQISVEEMLVASSLLPSRLLPFPEIREKEEEPRVFMYIETRPPQEKMAVLPKIEKPETQPAKIKPKVEHFVEIQSVGITFMPPSTLHALPKVEAEKDSRVFSIITKRIPEKLEDRQPPQKTMEEAVKKEKPAVTKPEQKQIKTPVKMPEEPQVKKPQITTEEPPQPKRPKLPSKMSLLTMGVGYGPSLGSGLGGFLQLNTKVGLALHFGAGYYPTSYYYSEYEWVKNEVLYSVGIKYYLPIKNDRIHTYLDLQYGGVSIEAVRIIKSIWYYQYIYENIQKTLLGPSLLAGVELKLGSIGLNGAIGLSYSITEWDYWERDYFLTADVGLLIYLW